VARKLDVLTNPRRSGSICKRSTTCASLSRKPAKPSRVSPAWNAANPFLP